MKWLRSHLWYERSKGQGGVQSLLSRPFRLSCHCMQNVLRLKGRMPWAGGRGRYSWGSPIRGLVSFNDSVWLARLSSHPLFDWFSSQSESSKLGSTGWESKWKSSGRCKSKHSLQHRQRWHRMSFDLSASSLYHEYSTYVEHVRGRSLVSLMVQTGRAPPMFAMSFLRCMLTLFKAQCGPVAERSAVWHSYPQIWTSQKCWWNLDRSFLGQQALYPFLRCTLRMLPCFY